MAQIENPYIRGSILEARKMLLAAGYKLQGTEQSWQQALRDRNDKEILLGAELVIRNSVFREIRAAHLIQEIKDDVVNRQAPGLDPSKAVFSKDDQGREIMHHPDIPGSVKPERS